MNYYVGSTWAKQKRENPERQRKPDALPLVQPDDWKPLAPGCFQRLRHTEDENDEAD